MNVELAEGCFIFLYLNFDAYSLKVFSLALLKISFITKQNYTLITPFANCFCRLPFPGK